MTRGTRLFIPLLVIIFAFQNSCTSRVILVSKSFLEITHLSSDCLRSSNQICSDWGSVRSHHLDLPIMHEESECESENDSENEDKPLPLAEETLNESEKTAHYFVFSGDNKAGMHGYEKVCPHAFIFHCFLFSLDARTNTTSLNACILEK